MARISAYKFVSPVASGSDKSPLTSAATKNLTALNNIGFSLTGIANTVKDLHSISVLTVKNDKLYEQARRRREKREADLRAEEELENRKILKGQKGKYEASGKKALGTLSKDSGIKKVFENIFKPFRGVFTALLAFLGKIFALAVTRELLAFVSNPENQKQVRTFLERTAFVFKKLYDFSKWLVKDKFLEGFSSLTAKDSTFGERLRGLGNLLIGITTLGALLNPFGLIDAILRLLGMDFYRPDPNMVNTGSGSGSGSGKPIKKNNKTKTFNNRKIKTVKYDTKSGSNFKLEQTRKNNMMNKVAPEGFKWDSKTQKYVSKGPGLVSTNQKTGNVLKYPSISKTGNRTLLKFLGKKNTLLLKGAFKQLGARIPWMGGVFTAIYSLLAGEPIQQAMFKTIGSLVGGAIGTFLPIPWLGSILGMYAGEYIGDLFYMGFNGATVKEITDKVVADVKAAFQAAVQGGKMALDFAKKGFSRFYEGIPKWTIPTFPKWAQWADFLNIGGKEIPNPLWLNPANMVGIGSTLIKAFFTNDSMTKGPKKTWTLPGFGTKEENQASLGRAGTKAKNDKENLEKAKNALTAIYNKNRMPDGAGHYKLGKYTTGQIVYKPGFMGYNKKYYTFNGKELIPVSEANPLKRENFKSDEQYEAFLAGGGNAKLLEGGIKPEQIVQRGYKAIQNDGQLQSWEQTKSGDSTDVNQVEDGVQVINGEVVEVKNGEIVKGIDPNSNGDITNTGEYKSGYNDGYRDGVNETASAVELTNKETAKGNTRGTAFNTEYTYSGGDIDPRDIAPNHSILEQGFKNPFSPGFSTFASGKKSRPEDTVPDGAFGIGSKSTDDFSKLPQYQSTAKPKKAWWDPLGVFTGKSIGGLVPSRLLGGSGKSFFFGKIFKGISKAVSGVFNGVKKAVTGIVQSPIFNIASTILSFTPLAPIVAGVQAVAGIMSGNPLQAITGAFSLGSSFFPQTFQNITNGINNTFGKVLGGGINGFLTGGVQGALGGLMGGIKGMLPQGVQNFFGKIGGFIEKFPSVGGLINMIPGVANIPGLAGLFGLQDFGDVAFNPMSLFSNIADQFGLGGLFRGITGMMQGEGGFMDGLIEMASELGVNPSVLGVVQGLGTSRFSSSGGTMDASKEYAMQTSLEFIPIPVIIEKLTPIPRPIPINSPVPVKQPAPPQQQQQKK